MTQPPRFVAKDTSLVCKLQKSLYGLKQAPHTWYDRLQKFPLQYGSQGVKLYALVYADDILVTNSCSHLV